MGFTHQNYYYWWRKGSLTFEIFFKYLLSRSKYFWVVAVLSGANFSAQERLHKICSTIKCCQLFVDCPLEMVEMENIQTIADSATFLDTCKWTEIMRNIPRMLGQVIIDQCPSVWVSHLSLFVSLVLTLSFVNPAHTTSC